MGRVNCAISRRTENTRPCRSRGVWVCQIVCEWAFNSGLVAASFLLSSGCSDRPVAFDDVDGPNDIENLTAITRDEGTGLLRFGTEAHRRVGLHRAPTVRASR